jgi:hypothetical protein
MLDPGALGTLIIGLDEVRREQESSGRPRQRPPHRTPIGTIRRNLVDALRSLADTLEPRARDVEFASARDGR